jgi:hypothetical protein
MMQRKREEDLRGTGESFSCLVDLQLAQAKQGVDFIRSINLSREIATFAILTLQS